MKNTSHTTGLFFESDIIKRFRSLFGESHLSPGRYGFDLELSWRGKKYLIEIKESLNNDVISKMYNRLEKNMPTNITFVLITRISPFPTPNNIFKAAFDRLAFPCFWIGADEVQEFFHTKSMPIYSKTGNHKAGQASPAVSIVYASLTRQFPDHVVRQIRSSKKKIVKELNIGNKIENTSVVLTDLVNFSSLVKASNPTLLQERMTQYYRLARDLVFQNGGMLDKFIGDAILAVFGYPFKKEDHYDDAIKFAFEMIEKGNAIISRLLDEINEDIQTGTRVGIATGDLWPINIGESELEISLLGDTINLAARLEKNCNYNAILIDNITKNKTSSQYTFNPRKLTPDEAKGQRETIKAWEISVAKEKSKENRKTSAEKPKLKPNKRKPIRVDEHAKNLIEPSCVRIKFGRKEISLKGRLAKAPSKYIGLRVVVIQEKIGYKMGLREDMKVKISNLSNHKQSTALLKLVDWEINILGMTQNIRKELGIRIIAAGTEGSEKSRMGHKLEVTVME